MARERAQDDEAQIHKAVRLPRWLIEDIARCAERSGWDFSKQIRYELTFLRGKERKPYLPQPSSQGTPRKRQ